jgi:hypothetical protein
LGLCTRQSELLESDVATEVKREKKTIYDGVHKKIADYRLDVSRFTIRALIDNGKIHTKNYNLDATFHT